MQVEAIVPLSTVLGKVEVPTSGNGSFHLLSFFFRGIRVQEKALIASIAEALEQVESAMTGQKSKTFQPVLVQGLMRVGTVLALRTVPLHMEKPTRLQLQIV